MTLRLSHIAPVVGCVLLGRGVYTVIAFLTYALGFFPSTLYWTLLVSLAIGVGAIVLARLSFWAPLPRFFAVAFYIGLMIPLLHLTHGLIACGYGDCF